MSTRLTDQERGKLADALGSITLTPEIWLTGPHMDKVVAVVERAIAARVAAAQVETARQNVMDMLTEHGWAPPPEIERRVEAARAGGATEAITAATDALSDLSLALAVESGNEGHALTAGIVDRCRRIVMEHAAGGGEA